MDVIHRDRYSLGMRWWRRRRRRDQEYEGALRAAQRALFGSAVEQADALLELGHRLYLLEQRTAARRCFREALTRDTQAYEALYGLALVEAHAGRSDDARLFALQGLRVIGESHGRSEDAVRMLVLADALAGMDATTALVHDVFPQAPEVVREIWLSTARASSLAMPF